MFMKFNKFLEACHIIQKESKCASWPTKQVGWFGAMWSKTRGTKVSR